MKAFISPKNTKIILFILFFTVLFDQAGVLITMPVLPDLLHEITGKSVANTAQIAGFLTASYAFIQLTFGPLIGRLSDYYGRRTILVAASFVFIIDYSIMATATQLWLLFIGRIVSGITGACLVTALASVADISTPKNKTENYAFMYAVMGLGWVVGPLITSLSMRLGIVFDLGVRAPFYFAAAIALFNFMGVLLLMPETLDKDKRNVLKFQNPIRAFVKISSYPGLKLMFFSFLIYIIASQAPLALLAFFVKERLHWSSLQTTDLFLWYGICTVAVQLLIVPRLYSKIGNIKICYLGLACFVLCMLTMAFIQADWMLYLAIVLMAFSLMSSTAFSSLYTSQVKENEQGELQGVIASCLSLGSIIGSLLMPWIFNLSIAHDIILREANPFLLASLLTVVAILGLIPAFKKLCYKS